MHSELLADLTATVADTGGDGYRLLFECNPTPLYVFDRDSLRILEVNDAAVAKYQYSRDEFLALTLVDLRPADEVPRLLAYFRGEPEGYTEPGRWRHRLKDGQTILVEIVTHTLTFQGRRAEMVMATDVTELEATLSSLRASEERFRLLARATSDAIWDWDVPAGRVWRSDGFARLFGLGGERQLATLEDWSSRIHPDDRDRVVAGFQQAVDGADDRWEATYWFARVDGSYAHVRDHGHFIRAPGGQLTRAIGGMTDITERHRAAHKLEADERRHAGAYAALASLNRPEILESTDLRTVLRQITAKAAETLQVDRVSVWRFTPDRTAIVCDDLYHRPSGTHSGGGSLCQGEYPGYFAALATNEVIAADDARTDPRTGEFTEGYLTPLGITAMLDAPLLVGGVLAGVLCHEHVGEPREWTADEQSFAVSVASVVSLILSHAERLEADRLLRQQASLIDQAQDAIMALDSDGVVRFWSRGAERLYGWTADEAVGTRAQALWVRDPAALREPLRQVRTQGEWSGELEHQTRSGAHVSVLARMSRLLDPETGHEAVLGIITDITERKKLEQQFLRAQRLESIGILAGGIAHDLNNVLSPILMSIGLLRAGETDDARLQLLASVEASARRGASMVRQVLSFARGVEGARREVDVARLLQEIHAVVHDTSLQRVEVRVTVAAELRAVIGDVTQLHQVLMNLCVNARDAMPDGGILHLNASNVNLDDLAGLHPVKPASGPFVVVEVSDTGTGIPPEMLDQIFDPFFTTKDPGKGTGLGLPTSQAIVESHGGFIRVYSEPGRGTTFRVYLPGDTGTAAVATTRARTTLPRGNGELILVVDDEPAIRQVTTQILERFGYRVAAAANGGEAIEIYAARHDEIALVLTDMRMPEMDGPTLIRHIHQANPTALIIGSSGHLLDGSDPRFSGLALARMLTKPFTAGELLLTMRSCLDGGPPAAA